MDKLSNTTINDIAQYICSADGVNPSQVFPNNYRTTHSKFAREIENRSIALNSLLHDANLSRAKTIIKNNWNEIPEPVRQVLLAIRDDIQALKAAGG